jgi:hypothetical protein
MKKILQLEKRWPLASCVECGNVCVVGGPAKDRHLRDVPPDWYNAVATVLGPEAMIRQGFGWRDDGGPHRCPRMDLVPDELYENATSTIDPDAWDDL